MQVDDELDDLHGSQILLPLEEQKNAGKHNYLYKYGCCGANY
jgi:hypothetical protein